MEHLDFIYRNEHMTVNYLPSRNGRMFLVPLSSGPVTVYLADGCCRYRDTIVQLASVLDCWQSAALKNLQ